MNWKSKLDQALTREWSLPLVGIRVDWDVVSYNELVTVRGVKRYCPPPTILGVGYHGELKPSALQALGFLLAPTGKLVPRKRILGGLSVNAYQARGILSQHQGVQAAAIAAGRLLGFPGELRGSGVRVEAVTDSGPNSGSMAVGDVITEVDGKAVDTTSELVAAINGRDSVHVTVVRAQSRERLTDLVQDVELRRDGSGRIGLEIKTHLQQLVPGLDVEVAFGDDSAGPSSGLAVALAVLDTLTPGSITGGRPMAFTGALDPDGRVVPVGGLDYKVESVVAAGIEVLVVPVSNAQEAEEAARGRLKVYAVRTLAETLELLEHLGGDPATRAEDDVTG